jgi:hypothetical protein
MRKFLFIFIAILAYLALSSKSCGSDEKDDAAKKDAELVKTKVSIKNEFESDNLSKKSLKAFEVKAKQELVDFSDYLGICSDRKVDESFKSQARQMILDMFLSDSIMINSLLFNEQDGKNLLIEEFLDLNSSTAYNSMAFNFDSITVTRPLRRVDDLNYKGSLSFSRRLKACSSSDTVFTGTVRMEAEIFVSKFFKPFGTDTLQVWGVFLGEIK